MLLHTIMLPLLIASLAVSQTLRSSTLPKNTAFPPSPSLNLTLLTLNQPWPSSTTFTISHLGYTFHITQHHAHRFPIRHHGWLCAYLAQYEEHWRGQTSNAPLQQILYGEHIEGVAWSLDNRPPHNGKEGGRAPYVAGVAARLFGVMRRLVVDSGESHPVEVKVVSQRSGRVYRAFSIRVVTGVENVA